MTKSDHADALAALPLLPRDDDGPVFAEPWQAQVFALVTQLTERGELTWSEWAERLGAEFDAAESRGDFSTGAQYYEHWLEALERLITEREIALPAELEAEAKNIESNDHHRREHQLKGHAH